MARKAAYNSTVEGTYIGVRANLEMVGLSTLLFGIVASFIVGDLLDEDSTGWACFDFYNYYWPVIKLFSAASWGKAIADYGGIPAGNDPLLYMISSLMPLHGDHKMYHVITFVVALLTWPLLSWAYYRRYSSHGIGWLWALFGAGAILLSPTFRSSAFWGTTDWFPFVFCAGTSLLLSRFQDSEAGNTSAIGPSTLAALAAVSTCAFYSREFYGFVPVMAAWFVLTRTKTSPLLVLSFFGLAMLPEMFLVYLWKGLNPPAHQAEQTPHLHTSLVVNLWMVGAMICLFSLPIVTGCIRRSLSDVLPKWWGSRSTVVALLGLLVFVMALRATEWPAEGGGIIMKIGLKMGAFGTPFILLASYFGFVAAILFSVRSATNALLAGTFLAPFFILPFFLAQPTGQRYLEPSLAVALFLFADTQTARRMFNKRVLTCNFVFSTLILAIGSVYYHNFSVVVCSSVARTSG